MTSPATVDGPRAACTLRVTGVVQGVGFRPFVHRLALLHGLAGWVRNASGAVQIHVEGPADALDAFADRLRHDAPVLARVEAVGREDLAAEGLRGFTILPSLDEPGRRQPVSPDVALCAACEAELFDPANRRYRYPFITCTDCGPRFTVIEAMPYDRERTSMRAFPQCPECLAEYLFEGDRRFHSETNSCPRCGPRVWFELPGRDGPFCDGEDAIIRGAGVVRWGGILALRGLGGFHLAADATQPAAVARLRERKHREAKPLAVMVRTLEDARRLGQVGEPEAALLAGPERPIVLLRRSADAGLADGVAPGLAEVGVMLAYTPLHHLLLDVAGRPLVMTSGNQSEEPIAIGNAEAKARLGAIADGFLLHDRAIVSRYDDSVVRPTPVGPVFLRRARGYAPAHQDLTVASPRPLVAVGPHLKNTLTLVHGRRAWASQHVGDLENLETVEQFRAALGRLSSLFRIRPEVAARDLHPGYLSTRLANELGLEPVIAVQHHHAHVAAVMAEHGLTEPVLGLAFDGTGYGDDGTVWGAELLLADLTGYRRLAHLRYVSLPGGDLAARLPWRSALAYAVLEPGGPDRLAAAFDGVPPRLLEMARLQAERGLNAPRVSSMGRLFDAAAALLGVRRHASYEGQAAMELESLAGRRPAAPSAPRLAKDATGRWVWDPVPLLLEMAERRSAGTSVEDLAAGFHESVAAAAVAMVEHAAGPSMPTAVCLCGGSFQNARLLGSVAGRLRTAGFTPLIPRRFSPNDGAVSLGQAAVAAALLARAG